MKLWGLIFISMIAAGVIGILYTLSRLRKFQIICKHCTKRQSYAVSTALFALVFALLYGLGGMWNTVIVFIHLFVFWVLADIVCSVVEKIRKRKFVRYWAGGIAVSVTILYLMAGYWSLHHVVRTEYRIPVEAVALTEQVRIVGFSDSHIGTTFTAEKLREYVERMNEEDPDLVVIAGDYVDDATSLKDMQECCAVLSELKAQYGVYFAFGNHDAGYYSEERRGYKKEDLVAELEKNGVVVLEDEAVKVADHIYLCGRRDTRQNRLTMEQLVSGISKEDAILVLDHEPNDYQAQEACGVDLVFSGHTHGGQFFPILRAGEWMGVNDKTYGFERRGRTNFVVSSGISNWEFWFKTGCVSEYVVMDLIPGFLE